MSSSKVAIVTGSSSGIGRDCATVLSSGGWKVVLSARRQAELEETAKLCSGETHIVAGDVTKEEDVKKLFEETITKFGRLDMLFNNAGVGGSRIRFDELSLDMFNATMNVNVTASFLCAREAFKVFLKQEPIGGRIINNGSISAITPRPNAAPYSISKHAITGLTKSIALDGRPFNITATQINIGNAAAGLATKSNHQVPQGNGSSQAEALMDCVHVANTVLHIANLPNEVTVLETTILATGMPFVGRG